MTTLILFITNNTLLHKRNFGIMKLGTVISFLLLCCSLQGVAQEYEYVPFPTENAEWKTDMWSWQCDLNTAFCEQVMVGVGESENLTINDTVYTGVYFSTVGGQLGATPYAAIRTEEDSASNKVWVRATSGIHQNEILLYDFNLNVGDTIPFSSWTRYQDDGNQNFTPIIQVSEIDTILVAGELRKRFHLLQDGIPTATMIIEGIGSTCGLGPGVEFWEFEHWWELQCLLQEGAFIYGQQYDPEYLEYLQSQHNYGYCQNITAIEEKPDRIPLRIYPNPLVGNTLRVDGMGIPQREVRLYDALGRTVKIQQVRIGDVTMMNAELAAGIYLVHVTDQNNRTYQVKLLKP